MRIWPLFAIGAACLALGVYGVILCQFGYLSGNRRALSRGILYCFVGFTGGVCGFGLFLYVRGVA